MLAGIQIYAMRALTLQFSGSRPCWLSSSKPDAATNSTRKSKAFAQKFDRQDFNTFSSSIPHIRFQIISVSDVFCCFSMELGHPLLQIDWQIGSKPQQDLVGKCSRECSLWQISRWLICLMNADHFCRNLLFRMDFRAATSRHSWHVSLQITFHSSFSRKDMKFPKQVLI